MKRFLSDWKYSIITIISMAILSGLFFVWFTDSPVKYIPMFLSAPAGFWAGTEDSLRRRYR